MLITASCRSTRLLDPDQVLVRRVAVEGIAPEYEEGAEAYIQRDIRPNSIINLFIYNLANAQGGRYRTDKVRNVGEPPRLLDSALVDLSAQQISRYLFSKGYFDAQVESRIDIRNRKAKITFDASPGKPFYVKDVTYQVADPVVDEFLRQRHDEFNRVRPGMQYSTDSLVLQRESVYNLMKRHGYYDYLRQYMRVDVDSNLHSHQANVAIHIDNPDTADRHTLYYIDSSYVDVVPVAGRKGAGRQRLLPGGIVFTDHTDRFRATPITRYLFQKQGNPYNLAEENLTYDRLYELNSFRSVKVSYAKVDSNRLAAYYELVPRPYMANQVEGEFTFNSGMSGFNIANTFSHRNLFGGAEQLDVKLGYGVLFDSRLPGNIFQRVFNNDFQVGVNVTVPRLLTPFRTPSMGRHGLPRTIFSSNLQVFDQYRTYSNRYFTNTVTYNWYDTRYKQHSVTPLALEYRYGRLNSQFAQSLIDAGYLLYVASNNRAYFGLGSQYAYTVNAMRLTTLDDFLYFRGALDLSGNTLNLLSKVINFPGNEDGEKTVLGVPYLQYAKVETDLRWYKHLGGERQLVLRLNPGVAIPYGNNSSLMIFEKSFFGGGMNGVRAWQARTLGPGGYDRAVLDPDLRLNLRNLDQLGELKLEANAEYRFMLMNDFFGAKLKGATFADMGNIWRISENELNPGGEFQFGTFLSQIAIGAGLGLRFDLDYFVIRLDAGIKVRDPQFRGSDQWVISELFNAREFKRNYRATHAPDRYNFIQYNFGIGLPF